MGFTSTWESPYAERLPSLPTPAWTSNTLVVGLFVAAVAMVGGAWAGGLAGVWLMLAAGWVMMGLVAGAWWLGVGSMRRVIFIAIGLRAIFFLLPPAVTDDAYRYIWDGTLTASGEGVYETLPMDAKYEERHDEAIYQRMNSPGYYSVYPPASQYVFAVGGAAYPWGWSVSYYVIKGIFAAMELGVVLLLARMLKRQTTLPRPLPEREGGAMLLLYAWHPLVLLEGAGQGHTEAAAALFLVATVWAARRDRAWLGGGALALAGMVKLVPFVLAPMLVRRMGWRAFVAGVVASLAVGLPLVGVGEAGNMLRSVRLYVQSFEFNAGLYYLLKGVLYLWDGEDWSKTLGLWMGGAFLALLPVLYILDWRGKWPVDKAFRVVLGAGLVLTTTVHPWYLLPVLALVPLSGRPLWHWHVLAMGSLGTYLFYEDGPYWVCVGMGWGGWLIALLLSRPRRDGEVLPVEYSEVGGVAGLDHAAFVPANNEVEHPVAVPVKDHRPGEVGI